MLVAALRQNGLPCPQDANTWPGDAGHGGTSQAGSSAGYMRPIEELEGTWMNADCPREQYVIHGLRITRSDARGTRNFSIHWDQCRQRWQWGTHGRLSLQWLGEDAIAWVPDSAWDSDHARVWRWQRCGPSSQGSVAELVGSGYRPWRRSHGGQHADEPYSARPWRSSDHSDEALEDWRSQDGHHRDGHHHGHHRSHHRSHHREHHSGYGSHHRDRHSSQLLHRSDHSGRRGHAAASDIQAHAVLPCGLTPVEVYSLLSRDIMPEDYELLLRLDDAIAKPSISTDRFKSLATVMFEDFAGGKCSVCLSAFEEDDAVVALPCQHHFHRDCITRWLSECRCTCPLCCSEALPA
mmetsp:Transcript_112926/g.364534  ORF Transcript_112926/g.364534 Transcript_112926/m.364534 type:complete len:351 (-) Transcript_112926:319-1371(-)